MEKKYNILPTVSRDFAITELLLMPAHKNADLYVPFLYRCNI